MSTIVRMTRANAASAGGAAGLANASYRRA